MRLWPSGITIHSTDVTWTGRAWSRLATHYRRHGTFDRAQVQAAFDRRPPLEWKEGAVTYLAANIRRHGL